jgi:hypothetical protein
MVMWDHDYYLHYIGLDWLGFVPQSNLQKLPPHEGMRFVYHKTPLLRKAIQYSNEKGIETRSATRIAHLIYISIKVMYGNNLSG